MTDHSTRKMMNGLAINKLLSKFRAGSILPPSDKAFFLLLSNERCAGGDEGFFFFFFPLSALVPNSVASTCLVNCHCFLQSD